MNLAPIKSLDEISTMTVIEERVRASGRPLVYYGRLLGYKLSSGQSGSSTFNLVARGRVIPNTWRRKKLAALLGVTIVALWKFDATGKLVARKAGIKCQQQARR